MEQHHNLPISDLLKPQDFKNKINFEGDLEFYILYGIYLEHYYTSSTPELEQIKNQQVQILGTHDQKFMEKISDLEENLKKIEQGSEPIMASFESGIGKLSFSGSVSELGKGLLKIFNSLTIFYIFVTASILLFGHTNLQQYTIALLHGCKAIL